LTELCRIARHLGATLNWRRDPAREMRLKELERELALLNWMHSEIDLIEAGLPSSSTPPPNIAARSSNC
jgi:hypothetical protein